MKVDIVVAEIGSTTTVLSAFATDGSGKLRFLAQGEHYTTVDSGDVTVGIERAIGALKNRLNTDKLDWEMFLATSSAAGGLKMTVHGLVYDMTVKAAREAALGAGAVIKYVTAGKLNSGDLKHIIEVEPRVILLAGGVDYGEKETVIYNAKLLASLPLNIPIIYAGNIAATEEVVEILKDGDKEVLITENVYPRIDQLNVEPTREIIREVFAENIIKAPGMEKIYSVVDRKVIPTPAAVMLATGLLAESFEDVLVVDIGGATTDVDSYTQGDPEIQKMLIAPEPLAKRTVEGDLGVFVNAGYVINYIGEFKLHQEFPDYDNIISSISPYPLNSRVEEFIARLATYCFETSIRRHAGRIRQLYGPTGRIEVAEGKDLTAVKLLVGTGGVLTRSRFRERIMKSIRNLKKKHIKELLPSPDVRLGYDKNYIFAAIGVLSKIDRRLALDLLEDDLQLVTT
ncbi:GlmL-related ornithine degradation protein [Kosmotoga pacifica]|uniref:DNA mismatch repair protein MutL n=1 Tax=Kosmotoga pacifica TaxID=1330330 RepID=A0A0G2Z5C1_9BACT|nr:GlmL-related ornithine degradation protein [Kosmotoga pacifica]AKI96820.1 DNA mismatch repair protein MutL [Kosmotoga pacifica]